MACVSGIGFFRNPAIRGRGWWCVFGCGFRLPPAPVAVVLGVCVCAFVGSTCTPPFPAGVCGTGACVRVSPSPRHPWLGCGVCVFVRRFCPYVAYPGWGLWRPWVLLGWVRCLPLLTGCSRCPVGSGMVGALPGRSSVRSFGASRQFSTLPLWVGLHLLPRAALFGCLPVRLPSLGRHVHWLGRFHWLVCCCGPPSHLVHAMYMRGPRWASRLGLG